jgi:hypothetical protein
MGGSNVGTDSHANCISTALHNQFGGTFSAVASVGEIGGHNNFLFQTGDIDMISDFPVPASGIGPGWRFGDGLHVDGYSPGLTSTVLSAHLDDFNPDNGFLSEILHGAYDGSLGHLVQFCGGSLDHSCH